MKIEIITLNAEFEAPTWEQERDGIGGQVVLRFGNTEVKRWQTEEPSFGLPDYEQEFVTTFIAAKLAALFKEE